MAVAAALLQVPLAARAQETRTIEGRKYIVHTVQAGQTLYGISRHYAVPLDALMGANPAAAQGLSLGQVLLVPQDAVARKELRTAPRFKQTGELLHVVAKKETLFGIAKKYGVEQGALIERNPDAAAGLREGMELVIPPATASDVPRAAAAPAVDDQSRSHLVEAGETLFGLGKRYGVSAEAIQAANGGLADGLKVGTYLRIPAVAEASTEPTIAAAKAPAEHYRVTFMLPFSIARNDSVHQATLNQPTGPQLYETTRIAAQFYAGAQLALDTLAARGLSADVAVVDAGDDLRSASAAMKHASIAQTDLFIGPFHRSAIEQLARSNAHAHIVCPVPQTGRLILGQPMVSKVVPSRSDLLKQTARYVAARHARDNIVVVRPDIAADKETQEQLIAALNAALAGQPARYRDSALVVKAGRRDVGDLAARLESNRTNVVVSPSEDVEFVTALVAKLKPLAAKQAILLVGLESWQAMAPVAASDLDLLGFTFAAPSFFDAADPATDRFVRAFRERFNNDADEYALLGYDVTLYYLSALLQFGHGFADRLGQVEAAPLHMGFRMSRTGPENGLRNEFAVMLRQRDLRLERAP